jgi:hypothetical protein
MSLIKHLQFTHREHGVGFTRDPSDSKFHRPYLLLEFIDRAKGKMLSTTLKGSATPTRAG